MSGILWLASYPKSGNTWLRVFLFNLLTNAKTASAIENINGFGYSDTHAHLNQQEGMSAEQVANQRLETLRRIVQKEQKTTFVKTHCCLSESRGYDQIPMEVTAGAICVLRNPLDVCISMAPHYGVSLDEAIDYMASETFTIDVGESEVPYLISSWSRHVDSWTKAGPGPSLHIVRYEDMLLKPGPTFKGIAKFMGLKPPTEALKRAIKLSSFDSLRSQEDKGGFEERSEHAQNFFRVGKSNQWKEILTPKQVSRVVEDNREMMAKFNYLPKDFR